MTQDISANLFDFPAREYVGNEGRWPSPDPGGLSVVDPNDPQSFDRYTYVTNNPLSETDPSGLCPNTCKEDPAVYKCGPLSNSLCSPLDTDLDLMVSYTLLYTTYPTNPSTAGQIMPDGSLGATTYVPYPVWIPNIPDQSLLNLALGAMFAPNANPASVNMRAQARGYPAVKGGPPGQRGPTETPRKPTDIDWDKLSKLRKLQLGLTELAKELAGSVLILTTPAGLYPKCNQYPGCG
jgi:RHS repeat-associated protein